MSDNPYLEEAIADAENNGVPPSLFTNLIGSESGWNPSAVSSSGAIGLGQILPTTAAQPGYGIAPFDVNNPSQNLEGAAEYLSALHGSTGSWEGALNAYNTGDANTPNNYGSALNTQAKTLDGNATNGGFGEWFANTFNDIFGNPGDGSQIATLNQHGNDLVTRGQQAKAAVTNWIEGGFIRIVVAIFIVAMILIGVYFLVKGETPIQEIKGAVKTVTR